MGALHSGHLALVKEAKRICSTVIVSIFINPRQFNNAEDLKKYPRTIPQDLINLNDAGADVVFIPNEKDLYGKTEIPEINLQPLDSVFEGAFRPGHFKGVVQVLHRLFSTTRPDHVFFGLKDLQQCLVIEKLVRQSFPAMQQHNCPTLREASGLAMSSRNVRLTPTERENASGIYKELNRLAAVPTEFASQRQTSVEQLKQLGIDTEYLELASLPDLASPGYRHGEACAIVFAGYLGGVRLIDNLLLNIP